MCATASRSTPDRTTASRPSPLQPWRAGAGAPMRAPISPASHARLRSLTTAAFRAAGMVTLCGAGRALLRSDEPSGSVRSTLLRRRSSSLRRPLHPRPRQVLGRVGAGAVYATPGRGDGEDQVLIACLRPVRLQGVRGSGRRHRRGAEPSDEPFQPQMPAARKAEGLAGVVLVAPVPPTPVGVTEQVRETVSHAYDDEEAVLQSIDLMLTHGGLPPELRRQVVEDGLRAGDQAPSRVAGPGPAPGRVSRCRGHRGAGARSRGRPRQGRPADRGHRSPAAPDPDRFADRPGGHRPPLAP